MTYRLRLPPTWRLHPVIWVGHFKPYRGPEEDESEPDYDDDGNPMYEVDQPGHRKFFVRWMGYWIKDRQWIDESALTDGAMELLLEYAARHQLSLLFQYM